MRIWVIGLVALCATHAFAGYVDDKDEANYKKCMRESIHKYDDGISSPYVIAKLVNRVFCSDYTQPVRGKAYGLSEKVGDLVEDRMLDEPAAMVLEERAKKWWK